MGKQVGLYINEQKIIWMTLSVIMNTGKVYAFVEVKSFTYVTNIHTDTGSKSRNTKENNVRQQIYPPVQQTIETDKNYLSGSKNRSI